jgi:hypothetical protein
VYGFTNAEHGWDAPEAWGFIAAGVVLMALFVLVEATVRHPLLPLRVATERNRGAAFLASFLSGAVLIGGIHFINFYIQIVLGFAPFLAGLASLPMTLSLIITAGVVARNLPKLGAKIPTAAGPVCMAAAPWASPVQRRRSSGHGRRRITCGHLERLRGGLPLGCGRGNPDSPGDTASHHHRPQEIHRHRRRLTAPG